MRSTKKPKFGVFLAAVYGPTRSNSDGLAGSCLTIYPYRGAEPRILNLRDLLRTVEFR